MKRLSLRAVFALLLILTAAPAGAAGLRDVIGALENPFKEKRIRDFKADFFQEARIAALNRQQRARGEVSVLFNYDERPGKVPTVRFHWEYQEPTRQELVSDGRTLWVYLPENNQVIQSDIELVSQARENDPLTFLSGLGNLSRDFLIVWAEPNRDVSGNYVLELRPRKTTALINRMVIVVDQAAVSIEAGEANPLIPASDPERLSASTERRRTTAEGSESSASRSSAFFADDFDPSRPSGGTRATAAPAGAPAEATSRFNSRLGDQRRSNGPIFPILSTTVYDPNGNSTLLEFRDVRTNIGIAPGQFRFMIPAGVEVVRPTGKEMGF